MHPRLPICEHVKSWQCDGDLSLLDGGIIFLAMSRQNLRPRPDDWWIQATVEIAKIVSAENSAIVCGSGILHLDFTAWAAHNAGKNIFLDFGDRIGSGYKPLSHLTIMPNLSKKISRRDAMLLRDKAAFDIADKIVAVSVRGGGNMEKLCMEALASGKRVLAVAPPAKNKSFAGNMKLLDSGAETIQLNFQPRKKNNDSWYLSVGEIPDSAPFETGFALLRNAESGRIPEEPRRRRGVSKGAAKLACPHSNDMIQNKKEKIKIADGEYLWHFTRECAGPWPDATWDDYFAELAAGKPEAAHDAVDSLEHILKTRMIIAQGTIIRGRHKVVCFSAASPCALCSKPDFRSALGRWNFKPYAIGIKTEAAKKLGAKPVVYGDKSVYENLHESEKYLYQAESSKSASWRAEAEWRIAGDVKLDAIDRDDMIILVGCEEEKIRIEKISSSRILTLSEISPCSV